MRVFLLIVLAGGLGSGVRYLGSTFTTRLIGGSFPWGTLLVNVIGCLLIGYFNQLALEAKWLTKETTLAITTGFLGGLTTFSAMGYEGFKLLARKEIAMVGAYLIGSIVLGLICVWLGTYLAKATS